MANFKLLLLLLTLCFPLSLSAESVLVAVASNFTRPMQELAEHYEQTSGHQLELVYGSSGRLYAQIVNGAPFQVFLSADADKTRQLERAGLSVPGSRFVYARGALVLWTATAAAGSFGPEILKQPQHRLALANPALAPYGRAAEEVLQNLDLETVTNGRRVFGENIAQTFQFVETGNAGFGFVALSQVVSHGQINRGAAWRVPAQLHGPIDQEAVLLQRSADCVACAGFLEFVKSDAGREIIEAFGYSIP